ncbi:hypothetical protein [Saccharopolyspora pogona]|uniref:hypothetical protein n=1 Tax=Saccharopolyspora pogona TaxID=333966 RepID=UPI0016848BCD|nr:hypothetical protein [Saccharopolyspora pogona]
MKEEILSELRNYARWVSRRDPLVREARRRGATWSEIVEASGLAKQTIANILKTADPEEKAVQATDTAQYFPHHPHFVSVERGTYRNKFVFKPFTGREPEPVAPHHPGVFEGPVYEEWKQRRDELQAAGDLWAMARYRIDMEPLFQRGAKEWPRVVAAVKEMREAYAGLRSATAWDSAVMRLLDAQDAALQAMTDWDNSVGCEIARTEARQPGSVHDGPGWRRLAQEMGFDSADWQVGTYYWSDRSWGDSPVDDLKSEIDQQKRRLREIASFSKQQA